MKGKNMKFSKGYEVKHSDAILEEYEIRKNQIIANVSDDKMAPLLRAFIEALEEPCFFILELPLKEAEEKLLRLKDTDSFHSAVYYIDGCTKEELLYILEQSGELLIQDGMCSFGFASHKTKDEIFVSKYNVVNLYSKKQKKYGHLLEKFELSKTKKLITAWETFTEDEPGQSKMIDVNGMNVYDLPKYYKDHGIYRAEIREE